VRECECKIEGKANRMISTHTDCLPEPTGHCAHAGVVKVRGGGWSPRAASCSRIHVRNIQSKMDKLQYHWVVNSDFLNHSSAQSRSSASLSSFANRIS
jgi:hypothetical protein